MDKRLSEIFLHVTPGKGVIDVGTDHGYIPLALAQAGYPGNIIASDINAGPLDAARRTALSNGYQDRICFTLCPGLDRCDPGSVDTIIIAGMGGDMICSILDKAEWTMNSGIHLILQAMTRVEVLRYWLSHNGYSHSSSYVMDGRFDYQIIDAHYTGESTPISDAELYTGRLEDLISYPNAGRLVSVQSKRLRKEYTGLEGSARCSRERLQLLHGILEQFDEMERGLNDNSTRNI